MQIIHKPWTPYDEQVIIEMYEKHTSREIANILDRDIKSIENHMRIMKKYRRMIFNKCRKWSQVELDILCALYHKCDNNTISKMLDRSPDAITRIACELRKEGKLGYYKYKPWSKEEETIIVEMYATHSYDEIAKTLGRTISSISGKITKMRKNGVLCDALV